MIIKNLNLGRNGVYFTDKHGKILKSKEAGGKIVERIYNWYLDTKLFFVHLVSLHFPLYFVRKAVFLASGMRIGKGSVIHMGAKFFEPKNIKIGSDTIIGDKVFLDGREKLTIGDHVDFASEVMVYNSEHDINDPEFKAKSEPVTVEDYVFVGPRAIILPGVKLGKGSVVAAGAVVTKDVAPGSIVAGLPAKPIGERKIKELNYKLGRARLFQ